MHFRERNIFTDFSLTFFADFHEFDIIFSDFGGCMNPAILLLHAQPKTSPMYVGNK